MIRPKVYCKYCGMKVCFKDMLHPKQKVHTSCAREHGPDMIIDIGDYHAEVYTELLSERSLKRIIRNANKYAKQLGRE